MKYVLVLLPTIFLLACGGGTQPSLPPELMGGGNPSNQSAPEDPLSGLPIETPTEAIEESIEVVEENNEAGAESENQTNPSVPAVYGGSCDVLTADLETSFADMNFCTTNSDCQVAQGSCPFGCYLFHNDAIDFADYQPALEAYQASCNPCEYQCADAPRASERRCVEGRCVDARNQS